MKSYQEEYNLLQYYNFKLDALENAIVKADPFSPEFENLTHSFFDLQKVRDEKAKKVTVARYIEEGI